MKFFTLDDTPLQDQEPSTCNRLTPLHEMGVVTLAADSVAFFGVRRQDDGESLGEVLVIDRIILLIVCPKGAFLSDIGPTRP